MLPARSSRRRLVELDLDLASAGTALPQSPCQAAYSRPRLGRPRPAAAGDGATGQGGDNRGKVGVERGRAGATTAGQGRSRCGQGGLWPGGFDRDRVGATTAAWVGLGSLAKWPDPTVANNVQLHRGRRHQDVAVAGRPSGHGRAPKWPCFFYFFLKDLGRPFNRAAQINS